MAKLIELRPWGPFDSREAEEAEKRALLAATEEDPEKFKALGEDIASYLIESNNGKLHSKVSCRYRVVDEDEP